MDALIWVKRGLAWVPADQGDDPPLPEELEGAPLPELAEGRARLQSAGGMAYGLRRAVDEAVTRELGPFGAMRYGDTLLQVAHDRRRVVGDKPGWWRLVASTVRQLDLDAGARLLESLYNADNLKVRGLAMLERMSGYSEAGLRSSFIEYVPGRRPYKVVTPRRGDWPGWAERLAEGEAVRTAVHDFDEAAEAE